MAETRCRHGFMVSVVTCDECAADERRRAAARAIAAEPNAGRGTAKLHQSKWGVANPQLRRRPIPAEHRVALRGHRIVDVSHEED
jgi:hypothetical protein